VEKGDCIPVKRDLGRRNTEARIADNMVRGNATVLVAGEVERGTVPSSPLYTILLIT
jgi:hypothetical protein